MDDECVCVCVCARTPKVQISCDLAMQVLRCSSWPHLVVTPTVTHQGLNQGELAPVSRRQHRSVNPEKLIRRQVHRTCEERPAMWKVYLLTWRVYVRVAVGQ